MGADKKISPNVWYASEKKVKSASKFLVFNDKGSLDFSGENILFTGKKNTIQIGKSTVRGISMVSQDINWVTYIMTNILAIAVYYFVFTSISHFVFTGEDVVLLIVYFLIANGFGLLVGKSTKWILVEYLDKNGNPGKAYFADGSMRGWSGIFGGTRKIYDLIRS